MPIEQTANTKLAMIAGNGRFPIIFAQAAKEKADIELVAIGIISDTSKQLAKFVDKMYWIQAGQYNRLIEILENEQISKLAMVGQVNPKKLFDKRIIVDAELQDLLETIRNKKADTIFGAIANKLEQRGVEIISSTTYVKEFLPSEGTLTLRAPTEIEWEDIKFGKETAKAIANLDIGQTVVVKQKAVLAVEAMEGTDSTIRRAGIIGRDNIVVVKVSKPKQDLRFDIPVIGIKTIKTMIKAKATCLSIEANKTLVIDKLACIGLANKHKISIVAT
jgi:DUF1009 family protein